MSKFQKGDTVYRACVAEFEGDEQPAVIPAKIGSVCPQRDGSTRYHIRCWRLNDPGAGAAGISVAESELHSCPLAAMRSLVRGEVANG